MTETAQATNRVWSRAAAMIAVGLGALAMAGLIVGATRSKDTPDPDNDVVTPTPAPGQAADPGTSSDPERVRLDGFEFDFLLPAGWEATDRSGVLTDPNMAELYRSVVELRAPTSAGGTEGVGVLRRFEPAFTVVEDTRSLCLECTILDLRPITLPIGDTAEDYRSMVDVGLTRVTAWRLDGTIYELATGHRGRSTGDGPSVHDLILDSLRATTDDSEGST